MKNVFLAFSLLFFSMTTTLSSAELKSGNLIATHVSIINLIATPEKYHNTNVAIKGYLKIEFEGNAIYLSKSDYENSIYKNAIYIADPKIEEYKKFDDKYVYLVGMFNKNKLGHRGSNSGAIEHIEKLIVMQNN